MSKLSHTPDMISALMQAAVKCHQSGKLAEAAAQYNQVLAQAPDHAEALYLSGFIAYQSGAIDEALSKLQRSLAVRPGHLPAVEALAVAAAKAGKIDLAVQNFRTVAAHKPDAPTFYRLGYALFQQGSLDEALGAFRRATEIKSDHADSLYMLATITRIQGKYADAEPLYARAVAMNPTHSHALDEYGGVLYELGKIAEADAVIRQAIAAAPARANPYTNLGRLYQTDRSRAAEALALHDQAIALAPDYSEAHNNRGVTLYTLDRADEAVASLRRAIALKPQMAEPHANLGQIMLMTGNLAEGWKEYAWRWQSKGHTSEPRNFPQPQWRGEDLGAGKLLIWGEQGIGDELLYGTMVNDLVERGLDLVWECDPRLVSLVQRSFPRVKAVPRATPPQPAITDAAIRAQTSITDLGQYLRTSLPSFPQHPAYLKADAARMAAYRAQLLTPGKKRVIGISWFSTNPFYAAIKSSRLKDWAPLWDAAGAATQFVDLQYGDTASARAEAQFDLVHLDGLDLYQDIEGVAALIGACDLVITVSNTTAHIAGAMGVPAIVMVPGGSARLWYWGAGETGSPWYPTATVLKQQSVHDWSEMIARIAQQLPSLP